MTRAALLAVSILAAAEADKVTAKNWEHHPRVEAARAIYEDVKAKVEAKKLPSREITDCTAAFSSFVLSTDSHGVVRFFAEDFGSSDSAQRYDEYYDEAGRLRFVFAKAGAVPSAWVQARFWLDTAGNIVWQTRKSGGEGPTYYLEKPEEILVKNPKAFLVPKTRCDQNGETR